MQHRARKRFGQNFLHDRNLIARMVQLIDPRAGQQLVEIGPGLGALTRPMLERAGRVAAVELDRDLPPKLEANCAGAGELQVHLADALEFDFALLRHGDGRLRVVGNLPYNISTPLIFHLLETVDAIEDMHFTLQKEVVDRLAATPDSKAYGRLSVMVQYYCVVTPLLSIHPGAFTPVPKVDSAFVRLQPRREATRIETVEPRALSQVVSLAFGQRRKTLRNTLKGVLDETAIADAGIDPGARAEQVDVAGFVRLANLLVNRSERLY